MMTDTTDTSAETQDWAVFRRIVEKAAATRDGNLDGDALDAIAAFGYAANVDTVLALLARAEKAEAEAKVLHVECRSYVLPATRATGRVEVVR